MCGKEPLRSRAETAPPESVEAGQHREEAAEANLTASQGSVQAPLLQIIHSGKDSRENLELPTGLHGKHRHLLLSQQSH